MKYGIRAAGVINFISTDNHKALCTVERQSRRVLLVYIYPFHPLLHRKLDQGGAETTSTTVVVNKQHLNHILTQPDKPERRIVLHNGIQLNIGEIIRNQCGFNRSNRVLV